MGVNIRFGVCHTISEAYVILRVFRTCRRTGIYAVLARHRLHTMRTCLLSGATSAKDNIIRFFAAPLLRYVQIDGCTFGYGSAKGCHRGQCYCDKTKNTFHGISFFCDFVNNYSSIGMISTRRSSAMECSTPLPAS